MYTLKINKLFPSPLGDYVFNHTKPHKEEIKKLGVSVPSRGLCFQSTILFLQLCESCRFRPLSGIMFSINGIFTTSLRDSDGFRPLSGIMFSIRTKL